MLHKIWSEVEYIFGIDSLHIAISFNLLVRKVYALTLTCWYIFIFYFCLLAYFIVGKVAIMVDKLPTAPTDCYTTVVDAAKNIDDDLVSNAYSTSFLMYWYYGKIRTIFNVLMFSQTFFLFYLNNNLFWKLPFL